MTIRYWQRGHESLLLWLSLCVLVVFSSIVIFQGSAEPTHHPMDQSFVIGADLRLYKLDGHWIFQYPHLQWSGGISSTGVVGLYKLLINPSVEYLNWHIKLAAMVMWLVSALYLIRALIADHVVGALVLLGVGALGLQFLEPTSELIGGIFFNFFVLLICRHRFLLGGIALALFALAKVEMLVASLLVLIYFPWRYQRSEYMPILVGYGVSMVLLVAPALYLHGRDGVLGGRALAAFTAHYGWLFFSSLSAGTRLPFNETFNNPSTFTQAVFSHPQEYASYVGNSILLSINNLFIAGHFYVFGFLVMFMLGKYWRPERGARGSELNAAVDVTFILIMTTVVVAIIFAFVHVRYTARFAALDTILFAAMLEQACIRPERSWRTPPPTDYRLMALRIAFGALALGSLIRVPGFVAHPSDW